MSRCRMFLGGRSKDDLLCGEDFEALGIPVQCTTDDGSAGDQCLVTHPLEISTVTSPPDIIYACGPLPMLACIVGISDKYNVSCQVSIESMMACGMGACLGCAVEKEGIWEVIGMYVKMDRYLMQSCWYYSGGKTDNRAGNFALTCPFACVSCRSLVDVLNEAFRAG